jgi:hypothetical protein
MFVTRRTTPALEVSTLAGPKKRTLAQRVSSSRWAPSTIDGEDTNTETERGSCHMSGDDAPEDFKEEFTEASYVEESAQMNRKILVLVHPPPESLHSILVPSSPPLAIKEQGPWKRLPKPDLILIEEQRSYCSGRHQDKGDSATSRPKLHQRGVSFDKVHMRCYSQTIGDNPSVSCGPPIQLDWKYEEQPMVGIDEFEGSRKIRRRNPRTFCLNYFQRSTLLSYHCGFSKKEIMEAERNADKIRRQRNMTVLLGPAWVVEDFLGSAARKTKRFFVRGGGR